MYNYYHPYDPYGQMYSMYTSTTTVPTYTLHQTLMSLSDQQSQLYTQREQLANEEERLRRLRAVTLQRIRAQRLHETLDESDFEDTAGNVYAEEEEEGRNDEDQAMRETVMYCSRYPCRSFAEQFYRGILNDARARRMSTGLPTSREFQREIRVREMLDPSPRVSTTPFNSFHFQTTQPQFHTPPPVPPKIEIPQSPRHFQDTPVVTEVPQEYFPFPAQPQYFPEPPPLGNKRGSRRDSVRRDSRPLPESRPPPQVPVQQTLNSYAVLRNRLERELSTVPLSIQEDMPPTPDEQKTLQHLVHKLEEIITEVDGVKLLTEQEDAVNIARKIRRELITDIMAAIDAIEQHIQPGTPSAAGTTSPTREGSDDDYRPATFDQDFQQAIQEVLARNGDAGAGASASRRSVTVEDVPDSEY
jgi:hypothetical protein